MLFKDFLQVINPRISAFMEGMCLAEVIILWHEGNIISILYIAFFNAPGVSLSYII